MRSVHASSAVCCAVAGLLGAAAAAFGKFGFAACSSHFTGALLGAKACHVAAYCTMAVINAAMTALFVRSLRRLPSLQATVLSTAANMAATGLLGHLLFAEAISRQWAAGIALVSAGLLLICMRCLGVCAAGRTDAGVHARGQVVQFFTNSSSIDPGKFPYKLNSLLPGDIRVFWMRQTAPDFNVTVSALRKTYHYHLDTGAAADPLRSRYCHHPRRPLDLEAMRAGAALLVGRHDFTQFSNNSAERLRRNPVKTLQRLDLVDDGPAAVRLEVTGSGFLYKQVRHMTGALLALGEGRIALQEIASRLEVGNTQPPGAGGFWRGYNVAPAKGLQLFEVQYPPAVDDPSALLYPDLPHDEFGRVTGYIPGASSIDED
ncbi:hypothetical protein OEZ86_012549 [Tetradesmus obliquus]|nr:hypothetical protein OEZ86_012549 [Tetradesmus obliquus]